MPSLITEYLYVKSSSGDDTAGLLLGAIETGHGEITSVVEAIDQQIRALYWDYSRGVEMAVAVPGPRVMEAASAYREMPREQAAEFLGKLLAAARADTYQRYLHRRTLGFGGHWNDAVKHLRSVGFSEEEIRGIEDGVKLDEAYFRERGQPGVDARRRERRRGD
jgi:hypothetical protein